MANPWTALPKRSPYVLRMDRAAVEVYERRLCNLSGERQEQFRLHTVESFWSMLKRGYYGAYHRMSAKHLDRHVSEFAGRHNIRSLGTMDQMAAVAQGMSASASATRTSSPKCPPPPQLREPHAVPRRQSGLPARNEQRDD